MAQRLTGLGRGIIDYSDSLWCEPQKGERKKSTLARLELKM